MNSFALNPCWAKLRLLKGYQLVSVEGSIILLSVKVDGTHSIPDSVTNMFKCGFHKTLGRRTRNRGRIPSNCIMHWLIYDESP